MTLVLVVLAACATHDATSTPTRNVPPPRGAASPPDSPFVFVPVPIARELAGVNLVFGVEVARAGLANLLPPLPAQFGCVHDLVGSMGIVVAVDPPFEAYATGLSEPTTRACVEQVASLVGASGRTAADGSYLLALGDQQLSLAWRDATLVITTPGAQSRPAGPAAPELRTLAARVPADAFLFMLAGAYPDHQIRDVVLWVRTVPDGFEVHAQAEGTAPGAARRWLASLVGGFVDAAKARSVAVDERWFVSSGTEPQAVLDVHLPRAALHL
ncbi:MAG TPA: hypothetical protein VHE35_31510 [Kofleriaceae bacterium]|nr:hypothetical protein [Kofleriaceae bacterium]